MQRHRRFSRPLLASVVAAALIAGGTLAATGPATAATAALITDPASTVDPFVGTSNSGNTFPGAVAPFGMAAWSPDQSRVDGDGTLKTSSPGGYAYDTNTIRGFSMTHVSGAGCAGLSGDIPFMPLTQSLTRSPAAADSARAPLQSTFSHANERATPGSYAVTLDSGVAVDLAATTRTGSGTFTYPAGTPATMLVRTSDSAMGSSAADVTVDAKNRTISGSVTSGDFCGSFVGDGSLKKSYYTLHFTAVFDADFRTVGTWTDGTLLPNSTTATGGTTFPNGYPPAGKGSGAYVSFDTSSRRTVGVRVGISYVSAAGAAANLQKENPAGTSIATVKKATHDAWNAELNRIQTGGGAAAETGVFYTALYHSLLHPSVANDVDGNYTGMDRKTHALTGAQKTQYQTFSGWDVYRSQLQLVTLLDPKRGSDIAASLFNQANQNNGVWDRWTHNSGGTHVMVGDPSAAALAGIVAFGGTDFDIAGAYASLARAARTPTADDYSRTGWNIAVIGQRPSLDQFLKYGYYPEGCNAWGCPNETLEMGAADAGLAQLARRLGLTADYAEFSAGSQSWQNQFNPQATPQGGYIQGRNADGSWTTGFDPARDTGFVEGTAAQYVWMVQHNPAGLFAAMGGQQKAAARLDSFFHDAKGNWTLAGGSWSNNTQANVDNEPSIAAPWLYDYAGQPWKTQATVRQAIRQLWIQTKDGVAGGPDGIPGNDDLGQMSSWLVFAAMGLYPENPSRAELATAAPLFPEVVVRRANGPVLHLSSTGAGLANGYITSMTVGGAAYTRNYLDAAAITRNTDVGYVLSASANTGRGTAASDAPPSVRDGEKPPITSGFEPGQPAPVANTVAANDGIGGYCCGLTGPETKVQGGDPHAGAQSVVYSGRATKNGATAATVLLDVDAVPLTGGETLSYWIRPQQSTTAIAGYVQDASAFVALDVRFTDGSLLSSAPPTASNGAALTASAQGSVLKPDVWNQVRATLPSSVAGKKVDALLLRFAPGARFGTASDAKGYLRGFVDDVALGR